MPIIKSAKKAARQTTKRTLKNAEIKKDIKSALKAFKSSPSAENMKKIQSEYDKAVKKGLMKKNTASRRKSRLAKILKDASSKPAKKATSKKTTAKKTATKKPAKKATTSKTA